MPSAPTDDSFHLSNPGMNDLGAEHPELFRSRCVTCGTRLGGYVLHVREADVLSGARGWLFASQLVLLCDSDRALRCRTWCTLLDEYGLRKLRTTPNFPVTL